MGHAVCCVQYDLDTTRRNRRIELWQKKLKSMQSFYFIGNPCSFLTDFNQFGLKAAVFQNLDDTVTRILCQERRASTSPSAIDMIFKNKQFTILRIS